ncbi:uncharacterized protein [Coffea arabica]|uniref:E3 ubiquitin-protein ligase RMA n=1 Tax=Coffea arabica TaxID=13443 RepID=A0A6P6T571_COFAR|nr:E3 ubiquitin-protein ligase RNF185-like [Coffea arabica]XP_027073495.1 E3 ubiquitin-protein ligase RNF185-like [Coffea arabica]
MASDIGKSATATMPAGTENLSSSGTGDGDASDFECNICFDIAQDPIVTLCGHLYCWPCLFRWLRHHSHSHECPVCKALIQEEKLVPLYGRGRTATDPRSKPVPGVEIPDRPAGQRPQTAPPPHPHPDSANFLNFGLGLAGGFLPVMTAGFGSFAMLAGFGGILPSMFSFQIHGFPTAPVYGTGSGYPHTYPGGYYHGANVPRAPMTPQGSQAEDNKLLILLLIILSLVVLSLIW